MHIEKLKHIQETLASAAESQIYNLECVDAKELGEVIDIIKDIEETFYYCSVIKAMEKGDSYGYNDHQNEVMYYNEKNKMSHDEMTHKTSHSEKEYPEAFQEERNGRSYHSRRMYLDAKEKKQDKTTQMRELEKYAQELTQDIVEMVQDSTPEEKQYLSKKIAALSNKIAQLNDQH